MIVRVLRQRPAAAGSFRVRSHRCRCTDAAPGPGGKRGKRDTAFGGGAGGCFFCALLRVTTHSAAPSSTAPLPARRQGCAVLFSWRPPYLRRRSSTTTAPAMSTAAGSTNTNTSPSAVAVEACHRDGLGFQRLSVDEDILPHQRSGAALQEGQVAGDGLIKLLVVHVGAADPDHLGTGILVPCPGGQRKGAICIRLLSVPVVEASLMSAWL